MDKTIQTNLCKGLRACGIPKKLTHQILNEVEKWVDNSGVEWTVGRIKDLRQWYETYLTGSPVCPEWFKHGRDQLPLGVWKQVFGLPVAKALGVLSLSTVFYETKLSDKQKEKFLHAIQGNGNQDLKATMELADFAPRRRLSLPRRMPKIEAPTIFDMNGSVPVHDGRSAVHPGENYGLALKALEESWDSVPQVTFDFLYRQGLESLIPLQVLGNEWSLELNKPHSKIVGKIGVIQQPELKARIVGNPNRVLQKTLEPLKHVYMSAARAMATDCTFDHEQGILWVQTKLKQGIELAGSDLTSASDLLDLECCLALCDAVYGFSRIDGYQEFRDYFLEVCRGNWFCPALGCEVQWSQGDVLGTGPSFGLLTLTNNAAALIACKQVGVSYTDSFRVLGDDIIMLSSIEPAYTKIIETLGGEINHSKTLKSDKVAEFAGRIITPDTCYLKKIKYSEPSDNSFMSYMSQLGDQAKYFLRPKQRQVYNLFKEVPGIVVPGPWMQDSYGLSLGDRYSWYLCEVEPSLTRVEPDQTPQPYEMTLLKASLELQGSGEDPEEVRYAADTRAMPLLDTEGYLPSETTTSFKRGGDPRLVDNQTLLDGLYRHVSTGDITPFADWLQNWSKPSSDGDNSSRTEEIPREGVPNTLSPNEATTAESATELLKNSTWDACDESTVDEQVSSFDNLWEEEDEDLGR